MLKEGVLRFDITLDHLTALSLSEVNLHNSVHQDITITNLLEARCLVDQIVPDSIVISSIDIRMHGIGHRRLIDEKGSLVLPVQSLVDHLTLWVTMHNFL